MSTYAKPHLTYEDQLKQLIARNLTVTDEAAAISYLKRLGYYRLSAYWYPFRKPDLANKDKNGRVIQRLDEFVPGTSFQKAVELYVFDKKLRMLMMDAIERIEVAVRVDIAHTLGARDKFAHTLPGEFHGHFSAKRERLPSDPINAPPTGPTNHDKWIKKLDDMTTRSKEDFVRHYRSKHGLPLPIWVVIELWDFGMLSHLFSGMRPADQAQVSGRLGIPDPKILASWLRAINFARNVAAHHSRYFNRSIVDQPDLPAAGDVPMFDAAPSLQRNKPYATLCVLSYLMKRVCPQSHWYERMRDHLLAMPAVPEVNLDTRALGCPQGWEKQPFWS